MRDWSINLPSWAYQLGYRLQGGMGAYDKLELYRNSKTVRIFDYFEVPNIIEIGEIIEQEESYRNTSLI